jgi:tetratricopeptide (TPR) repeat protein
MSADAAASSFDDVTAVMYLDIGKALEAEGARAEAAAAYRRAAALAPHIAEAHARLAVLLHTNGQRKAAIPSYRRAAAMQPDSTLGRVSLACALLEEEQVTAAEECLRRAAALDPNSSTAQWLLGEVLKEQGRFDEATECYQRCLAIDPHCAPAYFGLASSKRFTDADRPLIEQMTLMLSAGGVSDPDLGGIHFALGKAFDDLGRYESAIWHYDEANRLSRTGRSFDRERLAQSADRLIGAYTRDFFERNADLGSQSDMPILILGMMRSGTTLVEQIISSHPAVGAGGELGFWTSRDVTLADAAPDRATASRLATEYESIMRSAAHTERHVTDKTPRNFEAIGLIHLLFPNARIIHCRRHPVDTCLSIYFRPEVSKHFANDRGNIACFYEQYLRLMAHWRRILSPRVFFEVDYNALIGDRERTTRQIIEFCGLEWSEACLEPEENKRVVRTASAWQVRQPVYRSSLARWRHYASWLGEFARLLGHPVKGSGQ